MMAMLYASKICMEAINPKTKKPWEFADVPPKLKKQVADILINECGLPACGVWGHREGGVTKKPPSGRRGKLTKQGEPCMIGFASKNGTVVSP